MELFVRKKTQPKLKLVQVNAFLLNCMNYDHNKKSWLFKFQSGYRKLYLNSPKGYSRKQINAQTVYFEYKIKWKYILMIKTVFTFPHHRLTRRWGKL